MRPKCLQRQEIIVKIKKKDKKTEKSASEGRVFGNKELLFFEKTVRFAKAAQV